MHPGPGGSGQRATAFWRNAHDALQLRRPGRVPEAFRPELPYSASTTSRHPSLAHRIHELSLDLLSSRLECRRRLRNALDAGVATDARLLRRAPGAGRQGVASDPGAAPNWSTWVQRPRSSHSLPSKVDNRRAHHPRDRPSALGGSSRHLSLCLWSSDSKVCDDASRVDSEQTRAIRCHQRCCCTTRGMLQVGPATGPPLSVSKCFTALRRKFPWTPHNSSVDGTGFPSEAYHRLCRVKDWPLRHPDLKKKKKKKKN